MPKFEVKPSGPRLDPIGRLIVTQGTELLAVYGPEDWTFNTAAWHFIGANGGDRNGEPGMASHSVLWDTTHTVPLALIRLSWDASGTPMPRVVFHPLDPARIRED
jgi:hypothetical protein